MKFEHGVEQARLANKIFAPALIQVLQSVQRDISIASNSESLGFKELKVFIESAAMQNGLSLSSFEQDQLLAYLENNNRPFGILQELIEDSEINDLIISSYDKIEIQKGRKNYKTNLSFPSPESYHAFVEKILNKCGTSYSHKLPIVDAMFSSWVRIHAVHSSLAEHGPYLTIRINRHAQILVEDLIDMSLAPIEVFDYLKLMIRSGQTIMVAGEVGSGKTTLARALAASIPSEESILVIEDTPEIQLAHPHARYIRTRTINAEGEGRITPSECIRAGMRMAMNRIVFGEIRDAESAEAFVDVCASGHPGLSTVHAKSAGDALARLELFLGRVQRGATKEVIAKQLANSIQAIVYLSVCKFSGKRRIVEVREICGHADQAIRQTTIFKYQNIASRAVWKVQNRISKYQEQISEILPTYNLINLPQEISLGSGYNLTGGN